jgi:hypothetical protein
VLLYRDGGMVAALPGGSRTFVDTQATPGLHLYAVRGRIGASKSVRAMVECDVRTAPRFRRGDADGDGRLNITDAIFTLSFLFTGGRAPGCHRAADTNDSGRVDISDAIASLSFLFTGGRRPPAPHPDCGEDPTPDGLACETQPDCR